uniref:EGF-like domain-containing protein n=1 Tax=Caenorhabditis tropicalis TaxID=1561998 RepID=A0A1I7U9D1_9PELO
MFCAAGFGGPKCDQRPCETNPCLNNGTCRTTKGYSTYFCECASGFGGKNCDVSIGSTPPEEKFGKNVEQISSGKEEWIAQMRQRLKETGGGIGGASGGGLKPGNGSMSGGGGGSSGEKGSSSAEKKSGKNKKSKATQVADEPYKDPATRKREREEREKKEAEIEAAEEEEKKRKEYEEELQRKKTEEMELEAKKAKEAANSGVQNEVLTSLFSILTLIVFREL